MDSADLLEVLRRLAAKEREKRQPVQEPSKPGEKKLCRIV